MFNFAEIWTPVGLAVLAQVILIDLTMAGDNVVIMGTLTSGLPARERRKVIMLGVALAVVFLIAFALIATQLLKITGLLLAGGLLLLWVAYNMWRELRPTNIARARGSMCGVRSPVRYGRKRSPSAPGGADSASSVSSS